MNSIRIPQTLSPERGVSTSPALIALGLAAGPVVALGFTRFAYALLLPAMRQDLDWSYATAGGITTANAAGYVIGAASAAWWARRFGARPVFVWGMLISALSLLASAANGDFTYLSVIRFIGGLSTAVVFVVGSALASRIKTSSAGESAKMVGIYMAGVGIGVVLSGLAVPAVLGQLGDSGWPGGWVAMGILALIATVSASASSRLIGAGQANSGEKVSLKFLTPTFVWYLLYGAGYVSYMTFVIALLNAQGLTGWSTALFFIILGIASAVATLFVWGKVIGKLSAGKGPALVSFVVLIGVVPVLVWQGMGAALTSAIIFGAGFMAGPTAATVIAKRTLPASAWTSGIAALTVAFSIGQGLGPVVSGAMSDSSFGIVGGLWLSVILLFVAGLVALLQKESHGSVKA
jgi:predicted MFS family arabinose efflux permease